MKRYSNSAGSVSTGAYSYKSTKTVRTSDKEQLVQYAHRPSTSTTRPKSSRMKTAASSQTGDSLSYMAICESRGITKEIGVARIDLVTYTVTLTQYTENPTFTRLLHRIHACDPKELLVPCTNELLFKEITSKMPGLNVMGLARRVFKDDEGKRIMKNYGLPEQQGSFHVYTENKYYALCALAALFAYLQERLSVSFHPNTVCFKFEGVDGTMLIDYNSTKRLELTMNYLHLNKSGTLFSVLDYCYTNLGKRVLRANILQPSTSEETLELRLDAIDEMLSKPESFEIAKERLKSLKDIDHVISGFVCVNASNDQGKREKTIESTLKNVLRLKNMLAVCSALADSLTFYENPFCSNLTKASKKQSLREMVDSIMELINPNLDSNSAWSCHQALFAVQTGASQLLDVARTIYQEVTGDIEELCQSYAEQYDLNIKLAYNSQRMEYYFKVENSLASIDTLPAVFKHKKKVKKCIEFTSLDLMKLNERLKGTHIEILILSQKEAERMTDIVRQQISSIHQLCEAIGQLDLIMSLCLYKQSLHEGTRPEFHQNTIAIKNGRHPVLDRMLPDGKCIANDVYAFSGSNFNIIQGPNMSGKSTYLKQVGLLQIMAQIGSYVPAEYCCVRICDSLFTRMSLENELEADTSAFTREMRDMSCILQNITENSLVLIDELGRGTSSFDGVGIATALSEKLIQTQCFTFFVTHFVTLCDFLEIYPSVKVVHLHVEVTSDMNMKYSFKLTDGKADVEDYGLLTARKAGFHEDILNYAVKINEYIKETEEELLSGIEGDEDKQVMKKAMGLYFKLKQICLTGEDVDLEQVRTALIRLKQTIKH